MLMRWNDWGLNDLERTISEFDALRHEMNRLFDGNGRGGLNLRQQASGWPRVGLYDRGSELLVRAEVPGISEKDLEINLDQGVLSLQGSRTLDVPEGYSVHRQERAGLTFARSFALPCKVDAEKAQARLKHGVLSLTLPKMPEDQPRRISVSTK